MQSQGWHESDGNMTHFYSCGFNLPRVVHHLMNYADLLTERKITTMLNANATPYESKWMNKVEIEEKVDVKSDNEENNNANPVENNEESQQGWKTCKNKKRRNNKK